ncbi:hypothetical protein JKG68_03825 [Microvirga aerilata]|jgi:hypothetical protein|uniref:Lipoprotein n=1 Tax=Microvirga aerilata TaxID=670292 RepID=A0A936Z5X9_9HYPH|nr:hypothetical protein [Microvirga aerilata]MBL0403086.1 hypothetical protein [Microvirga aerilata]
MQRVFLASLVALAASACAYRPEPTELVKIVDSPADIRACTRLGEVSPVTPTTGTHAQVNVAFGVTVGRSTFGRATDDMLQATVALGGTHLYLQQVSQDWSLVRGIAYRCGRGTVRQQTVIRAKG